MRWLLAAVVAALCLASCGKTEEDAEATTVPAESGAPAPTGSGGTSSQPSIDQGAGGYGVGNAAIRKAQEVEPGSVQEDIE